MVLVRGRHPGEDKREVCPTCLADRMDTIQEMSSRSYGQAFQSDDKPKAVIQRAVIT